MKKVHVRSALVLVVLVVATGLIGAVSLAAPTETRGAISIAFDDGMQSQYDYAFPLMQARGIVGTFYVITDAISDFSNSSDFMSIAELQTMQDYGCEIASHSKTHPAFTGIPDSQIRLECNVSKQVLQSYGFSADNFAYPYGSRNDHTDSIVAEYYRSARSAYVGPYIMQFPVSQFLLPGFAGETGDSTALSKLESMVDQVYSANGWAIIFFHSIIPGANNTPFTISSQDFESFLDYIIQKGVATITVNQGLGHCPLTISTNCGTVSPSSGLYDAGSTISISATAPVAATGERYVWLGWTGSGVGSYTGMNNPASITMNGAITETASWTHQYQLTMATNFGATSPTAGSAWYNAGTTVAISAAAPSAGAGERYVWNGWTGSGTGSYTGSSNSATVTMNGPINEVASWTHQYYLTVSSPYGTTNGQGWYTSGATAYAHLNTGTVSGGTGTRHVFSSWTGDASGTNYAQSNGITMSSPKTATANWKTQYSVSFAVSPSEAGATSPSSANLWEDAGALSISATANPGYTFSSWSSSTGSITFADANLASTTATISGAGTITANFNLNTYTITASAGSGGSINPSGAVIANYGDSKAFTITPDTGYHLSDVLVDGVSESALTSYTFTNVTADHTISASFAINTYTVTFTESGLPSGTSWSVTLNGVTQSSTTATITFTGVMSKSYPWSASTPISGWSGTRHVASTSSGTINVPTQTCETITYATQYYLTVNSPYGSTSGGSWYYAGATAYATVTSLTVTGSAGVRYVFTNWGGTASGTNSQSNAIVMNAAATATANYKTQYYINVSNANIDPTPSAWVDAGKDFSVSVTSPADAVLDDHKFICAGYSVDGGALTTGTSYNLTNVEAPHTIVFNWRREFWVVFKQEGLPKNLIANVTVDSVTYTLPYSDWFDQDATVGFTFDGQLPVGFGTQYVLSSTSHASPLKIESSNYVEGSYVKQCTMEMYTIIAVPIVLICLAAALILLRRKKKIISHNK